MSNIRVLPHDGEVEVAVLGAMCIGDMDAALLVSEKLSVNDFYHSKHKDLFEIFSALVTEGVEPDVTVVNARIKSHDRLSLADVVPVFDVFTAANLEQNIQTIKNYAHLRRIIRTSQDAIDQAFEADVNAAAVVQNIEREIFQLSERESNSRHITGWMDPLIEDFDRFTRSDVRCGIGDIDEKLMWHYGLMYVIAGAPGSGKSSFVNQVLATISREVPVLYFSQEMIGEMVALRVGLSEGDKELPGMYDRWHDGMERLKTRRFFVDDSSSLTMQQLRAKALRAIRRDGVKVFAVDYLQLATGPGDNQMERETNLSKGIAALAKETRTLWLVISQLRKEGYVEGKRPSMADLRGSGQIVQDARGIYFLYLADEAQENQVTFYCEKQNLGAAHWKRSLYFDRQFNRFANLSKRNAFF